MATNETQMPLFGSPPEDQPIGQAPDDYVRRPLSSSMVDPYATETARIDRDIERAMATHKQAEDERAAAAQIGPGRLAEVRAQLARPEGWGELTRDEQLINHAARVGDELIREQPEVTDAPK